LIWGLPIKSKRGHIVCGRENCGKKGFIWKGYRKSVVQIPLQENITRIVHAMDYLAKLFYRSYDYAAFLPEGVLVDFFGKTFQDIIPFTPHTISDFIKFNNEISEKHLRRQVKSHDSESKHTSKKIEFNSNQLHKLSREHVDGLKVRNPNKLSSAFLFYSISYAALRDLWQDFENYHQSRVLSNVSSASTDTSAFPERELAKCLVISHSIIEYMVNNKHHIQIHKIPKLIIDSQTSGYRGAATKNSENWLWCSKCIQKGIKSLFVNGMCPKCKNTKRRVSKIDFKSIQTLKYNVVNDMIFFLFYRREFDVFMNNLRDLIINDPDVNAQYLNFFEKYQKQVTNSESSYLKKYDFKMCHYDTSNPSNKKSHSLTEEEILNSKIIDQEYLSEIHVLVANPSIEGLIRTTILLRRYNFPKEYIQEKILFDISRMEISLNSQNRIM
jgi:hypothetical protein